MPRKAAGKKRLVLLDAHAIIHRAYHALPDFTGPDGEPTGALYGLSSMLLRIIGDLKPDYLAACYDLPKPTIRHEAYEGYKATRTKTDDALVAQLATSRAVFEAFSIPIYEREGFEADDILGTIVEQTRPLKDVEVIIASGDMDTLQLVEKARVKVYTLKKGLNDTILYDAAAVEARYGFSPALVPDWKGLRGDPSDNIIGVPGIGEKTATDLVTKFGTIEAIYAKLKKDEAAFAAAGIKPRVVTLLKEHEDDAVFSKMLATIRTDAPIAFSLEACAAHAQDRLDAVIALFEKLGFRSLRARARAVLLGEAASDAGDAPVAEGEAAPAAPPLDPRRFREAQAMLWLLASDFTNPDIEDILSYAKERTFDTAYDKLEQKLRATGRLAAVYDDIEKPLVPVLMRMEDTGVQVDSATLAGLKEKYAAELSAIEARIHEAAGAPFNVNSPKQLGAVLFDTLGLVAKGQKKTANGQRSTRESELEKIKDLHPVVGDILEYREIQKLLSSYIESIPPLLDEGGRLHARFLQTGTTTGRMASEAPNLQNIPIRSERGRAIRRAFVAREGFELVALDYSQVELRIAAILSEDEKLRAIFRSGRDVHREVAAAVFQVAPENVDAEMRRRAKVINFGILYGMGTVALRAQLGTSAAEAQRFYDDYFHTFDRLAQYLEETKGFARRHGYTETLFGRRREFPGMKSPLPYVRAQAERMAINAPIQGTEADLIKLAMVRVDAKLAADGAQEDAHLILQVHDELVYEVRKEKSLAIAAQVKDIMERAFPEDAAAGVPIIADAKRGANWAELSPLEDLPV